MILNRKIVHIYTLKINRFYPLGQMFEPAVTLELHMTRKAELKPHQGSKYIYCVIPTSSRISKSGRLKRATDSATLILCPPDKYLTGIIALPPRIPVKSMCVSVCVRERECVCQRECRTESVWERVRERERDGKCVVVSLSFDRSSS